tara:strand:- start:270 stop:1316 length:1047 start_codon:yes stop_codon:yes gene_type:complete
MGYQRFATPRAYVDHISYNLVNGWSELSNIDIKDDAGSDVTLSSGNKEDLFDLKPHNAISIAASTQAFYIQFNTEFGTNSLGENNFIAILNHNFHSADAIFRVQISDASDFGSGVTTLSTTGSHTKVINADANDTAGEIDPPSNGWSLITFPSVSSVDNQYVRITIEDEVGSDQNFETRIDIGSIMYGTYIDWPHAMDINLTTAYDYDGTTIHNSVGGSTYASAPYLGAPAWSVTNPWVNTTTSNQHNYGFQRRHGRKKHSLNFSHMADTNVFSADQTAHPGFFTGDDLHAQFYNKIIGQHIPFLWTLDKTSTTAGDYGLYRLADSAFEAKQIGSRVFDVKMDLIESW